MFSVGTRGETLKYYNSNVDKWNATYRSQAEGKSLSFVLGSSSIPVGLPVDNSDDELNDADLTGVEKYSSLHFKKSGVNMFSGSWSSATTINFNIYINSTSDGSSASLSDSIDLMKTYSFYIYEYSSTKKAKCESYSNGYWDDFYDICRQKWILQDICMVVDFASPESWGHVSTSTLFNYHGCYKGSDCFEDPSKSCQWPHPHSR